MRIVLTGSSGRLGRAIFNALAGDSEILGIDRSPFSTTHLVGDFADASLLRDALAGADAIIHSAALHAPHVGNVSDDEFRRIAAQYADRADAHKKRETDYPDTNMGA